jgi:hypothetical protein
MPSPAAAAATVPGAILASGTALAGSGTGATAALACGSSQAPSLVPKKAKPRTDSIFSALVLATNVEQPAPPPPELAGFAPRLKTVFGYNSLELVGSHTELMDQSDERWLVPSKLFSLSIKSKKEKNASYLLNLQLFQETKMLAGFDAKLGTESPIFIRGPQYGKGQLVIVVEVKP